MMRLSLYEFEIKYKPGSQNILADFLSRPKDNEQPLESSEDYLDQLVAKIETIDDIQSIKYKKYMHIKKCTKKLNRFNQMNNMNMKQA